MRLLIIAIALLCCAALFAVKVANRTWHEKYNWNAEEYFEDPQVIALCKAIEANDINEIDRLVEAGTDVNVKGKGNMTPLMWAWPDGKLARFKRLLERGANPNVIFTSDLGTEKPATFKGTSVTHLVTRSKSFEHFQAVFDHGGDPNLVQKSAIGNNDTPIAILITHGLPNKERRIQLLIDKGADLNQLAKGRTLPMRAASWGGQYDIALMLLKAGADPTIYKHKGAMKLAHVLVREESRGKTGSLNQREHYRNLVEWLEKHGESLDEARAELDRWASWVGSPEEKRKKLDAEIAARKAREAREKKEQAQQREETETPK